MSDKKPVILVVRNDKMGDLILVWPALAWLKMNIPDCKIVILVSKKFRDLALMCENIDDVICDDDLSKLKKKIASFNFDISICFFSTFRIGYLLKKIGIPIRIAPKTKIAQFFHNFRLHQKRSRSEKPEYEYNMDIVNYMFEILQRDNLVNVDEPPYLKLKEEEKINHKNDLIKKYMLNSEKKIIFVHPSTGGSSKSLSVDSYVQICEGLRGFDDYNFMLHYTSEDEIIIDEIISKLSSRVRVNKLKPSNDMINMVLNISACDIFIAGSTGPLHVAGALNKKTVGFFPSKKSSTSLRWQTINSFKNRLDFTDKSSSGKHITVDYKRTILEIQKHISSL